MLRNPQIARFALAIPLALSVACGSSSQVSPELLTPVQSPPSVQPLSPATVAPSPTPAPTQTSLPPTKAPEPIHLSGSGDSITDFDNPFQVAIVHIVGNAGGRYFEVINHGPSGKIDLLVNTTDPYDGIRPLDFKKGEHTTRFEVKAVGDWTIDVLPLSAAHVLLVPGTTTGKGDDVLILSGATPDLATISGNSESRYFGVTGYSKSSDLLVNTTEPYQGTVILDPGTVLIEILSTGEWKISVTD